MQGYYCRKFKMDLFLRSKILTGRRWGSFFPPLASVKLLMEVLPCEVGFIARCCQGVYSSCPEFLTFAPKLIHAMVIY